MGSEQGLEQKAWEVLRDFESQDRVKAIYSKMHGRTPNTGHAREICAPFTHGRSYFESAKSADAAIRPLLLFYGVMNLSRGLVLTLSRGKRESALKSSHGLSCDSWADELRSDKPDVHCLNIRAEHSGAFIDMSEATGRCTMLRHNSSLVNMATRESGSVRGLTYCIGDILARLPHLERSNVAWRNTSLCSPWATASKNGDRAELKIPKANRSFVNRSYCDALFANTDYAFESETPKEFIYEGPNNFLSVPGVTDRTDMLGIGHLWLVARYPNEVWLSRVEALYSVAYAFGMLVRYFPAQWTGLLRGNVSDAALPTILEAIELVTWLFPVAVSDLLANQNVLAKLRTIGERVPDANTGYAMATIE